MTAQGEVVRTQGRNDETIKDKKSWQNSGKKQMRKIKTAVGLKAI